MIGAVAISSRLLNEGEHVVVSTRTHVKALLMPALWLILIAAVAGYASSFAAARAVPRRWWWWRSGWSPWRSSVWLVVKPFLALADHDVHRHRPAADHPHRHPVAAAATTSR